MHVYGKDLPYAHFLRSSHQNYAIRCIDEHERKILQKPICIHVEGEVESADNLLCIRVSHDSAEFIQFVERDLLSVFDRLENIMTCSVPATPVRYSCASNLVKVPVSKTAGSFCVSPGTRVCAELTIRGVFHASQSRGTYSKWTKCVKNS